MIRYLQKQLTDNAVQSEAAMRTQMQLATVEETTDSRSEALNTPFHPQTAMVCRDGRCRVVNVADHSPVRGKPVISVYEYAFHFGQKH